MPSQPRCWLAGALLVGTTAVTAASCAAVIGVDGDFVEGPWGGAGGTGAQDGGTAAAGGSGASTTTGAGGATTTTTGGGGAAGTDRPDGVPCDEAEQCDSRRCEDGVCCATACDGTCEICNQAGALGTCTLVQAGEDPAGDCAEQPLRACDGDGSCSGLTGAECGDDGDCISRDCRPNDTCA
jgi:hypothetical protein